MKFRMIWDIRNGEWKLQTPPCTSSEWDTISRAGWRWPLRIYAWFITVERAWYWRHEGKVEEFET
jgi:hypothetical protein